MATLQQRVDDPVRPASRAGLTVLAVGVVDVAAQLVCNGRAWSVWVVGNDQAFQRAAEAGVPERAVWVVGDAAGLERAAAAGALGRTVLVVDGLSGYTLVRASAAAAGSWAAADGVWALRAAVRAALAGARYVSPTAAALLALLPTADEYAVLHALLANPDATVRGLAAALGAPEHTVRAWLALLYRRAGVRTRAGLALAALRQGWLTHAEAGLPALCSNGGVSPGEQRLLAAFFRWPDATVSALATALDTPVGTLKSQQRALCLRLGAASRTGCVLAALRAGWVDLFGYPFVMLLDSPCQPGAAKRLRKR